MQYMINNFNVNDIYWLLCNMKYSLILCKYFATNYDMGYIMIDNKTNLAGDPKDPRALWVLMGL